MTTNENYRLIEVPDCCAVCMNRTIIFFTSKTAYTAGTTLYKMSCPFNSGIKNNGLCDKFEKEAN